MYQVNGYLKTIEQDEFENGCVPGTEEQWYTENRITGETIEEVLNEIAELTTKDRDCFMLNACGEDGRIDVQMTENYEGQAPSKNEIAEWKERRLRLWLADYTFHVQKVEPVTLPKIDGYKWEEPDN